PSSRVVEEAPAVPVNDAGPALRRQYAPNPAQLSRRCDDPVRPRSSHVRRGQEHDSSVEIDAEVRVADVFAADREADRVTLARPRLEPRHDLALSWVQEF